MHSKRGAVGATDLMRPTCQEVLLVDLTATDLATRVAAILEDAPLLLEVARCAAVRARSWDEAANARALEGIITAALAGGGGALEPSGACTDSGSCSD